MNVIETINLLSSDSDSSSSDNNVSSPISKQNDISFVTRRINLVSLENSTILFEDDVIPKKPVKEEAISRKDEEKQEIKSHKRLLNYQEMENMNSKSQRINETILHERSTLSADFNISIPSALNTVGLTEEEDRANTRRVRQLIENYRHNQDLSNHHGIDSILSEADSILNPPQSSNHANHTSLFNSNAFSQHNSSSNEDDLSLSPLQIKTPSPSLSSSTTPSSSSSSSISTPPVLSSPTQSSSSSTKGQSPLPIHIKSPSLSPSPTPSPIIKQVLPHLSSNTLSPSKDSSSYSMDNSSISPSPTKEIGVSPSSPLNKESSPLAPVKNLSISRLLSSFSPKRKVLLSTSLSPVKEQSSPSPSPSPVKEQSSPVKEQRLSPVKEQHPSPSVTDQPPSPPSSPPPVRRPHLSSSPVNVQTLSPSSSITEQSPPSTPPPVRRPHLSSSSSPSEKSSSPSTPPPVRKPHLSPSSSILERYPPARKPYLSPSPVIVQSLSSSHTSSITEQSPPSVRKPHLSPSPTPNEKSSPPSTPPPVRKPCHFVSLSPSSPSRQSSCISISSSPYPSRIPTSLNRQSNEMLIENSFSASPSDSSSIIISDKESSSLLNEPDSDSSTQVTSYSQTISHQPSSQKPSSQKLSSNYDEIMLLSSSSTSSSDEEPITHHSSPHAKESDANDDPEDDDYVPTGKLATEVITPKPLKLSRSVKKKRPLSSDSQVISILSSSSSSSESENSPDPILSQLLNHQTSSPVSIHSDSDSDGSTHPHQSPSFSQPSSQRQVIDDFDGFINSYVKDCSHTFHSQQQPPLQPSSSLDNPPSTTPSTAVSSHTPAQQTTTWSDFSSQQEIPSSKTRSRKHKQLLVCLEEVLANSEQGRIIGNTIGTSYQIGPNIHCPIHGVVLLMRKMDEKFELIKDCLVLLMDGNSMINIIKQDGLDGGLKYIRNIRELLLTSNKQKLFLILTNMQNIISEQRKRRRESIEPFTRDLLTELYIRLRLDCNITCFSCESEAAAAEWLIRIIDCIRDGPYLQPLSELKISSRGKYTNNTTQNTMSDKELFLFHMLQCVSGVSSTKALCVLQHYKSVEELKKAYDNLPTVEMREDLLSDKLGGSSKQRLLSKRIYDSFSCTNGNFEI